jgi:hypothetical protein
MSKKYSLDNEAGGASVELVQQRGVSLQANNSRSVTDEEEIPDR